MQATIPLNTLPTSSSELDPIFQAHHARMLRAAYRVTGDLQDAEDALQTVFVRLLGREAPVVLLADEGTYLHRAAVNAALDVVRSRKRAKVVPFDGHDETRRGAASRAHGGPQARPVADTDHELRDWLRARLATMSPMAAEMFALRYFEDFTNTEIADMLGTSRNSVAVILHRTRNRLREDLEQGIGEDDDSN